MLTAMLTVVLEAMAVVIVLESSLAIKRRLDSMRIRKAQK